MQPNPKRIYLIRHAQAQHNVGQRYHLPDPLLTELGERQARALRSRFQIPCDLVVSSPLKRALQTALLGVCNDDPLIALPELVETSQLPCDTGSSIHDLQRIPEFSSVDFSRLPADWPSKKHHSRSTDSGLHERARQVRQWLSEQNAQEIVVVTHGGFLHYLTEDFDGMDDFPGTGWINTELRTYELTNGSLIETERSRTHRDRSRPLTDEEKKQFELVEWTA